MATCEDTDGANACGFLYAAAATPVITGATAVMNQHYDDTVSFAGTDLTAASGNPVMRLSSPTVASDTDSATASATALTFKMPSLANGVMSVSIYIPGKGYAKFNGLDNPPLINNQLSITAISPTSGGSGGNFMTITGSGFDAKTAIILFKSHDMPCEIRSMTASQITCKTGPSAYVNGEEHIVKIKQDGTVIDPTPALKITTDTAKTVTITGVNGQTTTASDVSVPDSGYFDLALVGYTSLDETMTVKLWSAKNKRHFTGAVQGSPSSTAATVRFTDVPLDTYFLEVLIANKGYAYMGGLISTINVKSMATAPASEASNKVTSMVGGVVLISGKGFDSSILGNNKVSICGYPCDVTAATYSQLTCSHQGIITQEVDDAFRNEQPKVIKP